jgi:hypothetical protein
MIVLAALDPALGVPDALYEVLHWEPSTEEEERAGRVLRVHRDWLNGGLEQALLNLEVIEEPAEQYIDAYRLLGLAEQADVVEEAAHGATGSVFTEAQWDVLDDRYGRLTYGDDGAQPDAIEEAVVLFAQRMADRFRDAVARANG